MSQQAMNSSRRSLIDGLISLGPIFVMTIFIVDKVISSWWRYVIGIAAWILVASIYSALFQRFLCPKVTNRNAVTTTQKILYYGGIVIFTVISVSIFSILPFSFGVNLAISIVVNFILTMSLCYYVAKGKTNED